MRHLTQTIYPVVAVLAVLCVLTSAAVADSMTVQLQDPPSNNILDGLYVGPYSGIDLGSNSSIKVICDDFKDDSNYQAASYTVNSLDNLGNAIWGAGNKQLYQEAAWLASGMFQQTGATQGYVSYALWAIFMPSEVKRWLNGAGDQAAYNAVFGVGGLIQQAQEACQIGSNCDYANLRILTPVCNGSSCQEQEFFTFVPEGGAPLSYIGLAGTTVFGAVWMSQRKGARRSVRS